MKRSTLLLGLLAVCATTLGFGSYFSYAQQKPKFFSHASHFGANGGGKINDCKDCHRYDPQSRNYDRPGHNPCVDCHATGTSGGSSIKGDFTSRDASAPLCQNCHAGTGFQVRKDFPDPRKGVVALKNFSHKDHLDTGGKVFKKFGRVNCDNCHALKSTGEAAMPGHAECGQCHGDSAGADAVAPSVKSTATSKDCDGCHEDARKDETMRAVRAATPWKYSFAGKYSPDVIFSHQKHLAHSDEQACKECHAGVEDAATLKQVYLPSMWDCGKCHDDAKKVKAANVMDNCSACHSVIKKNEKPANPQLHYGSNHQAGAKQPNVYCGWCHSKDPNTFPIKQKYEGQELCKACHNEYGLPDDLLKGGSPVVTASATKGTLQRKNGLTTAFSTAFDFKQVDNIAAPLDQIDFQDADFYAFASIDSYGYGKENLGVSISGRFSLDFGDTPFGSPFASQFNIDKEIDNQQNIIRDDRGRFRFDKNLGAFVAEDFDRTQNSAVLLYRAFAELRDQPLGSLKADLRVGRQSVFDSAEPWLLFDGGYAKTKFGKNGSAVEVFGGVRTSLYTQDDFKPLAGANLTLALSPRFALKLQDVFHQANSTRAVLNLQPWPNLRTYGAFKLANFAPDTADAGFFFYNPDWGTQLVFDYRHKFDNTTFDYDYTTLSTRGGADVLLADPALANILAQNAQAQDAFNQISAARAEIAAAKIGKQIFDFENFNLFPEAPNDRFDVLLSQKISGKVFLNFAFTTRLVNGGLRNNANQIADLVANGDLNINQVDAGELAVINDAISEDNRFAFTYPFLEFGPGIDFYDVGLKGLHLAASAKFRQSDGEDVRLLFDPAAFFNDISGEIDNTGLSLNAEASQSLGGGKIRFGALISFHRFDYVGRFVVTDDAGNALTALNDPDGVQNQNPGLLNLNGFSGSAWLRLRIKDSAFLRALYTAETDLQFFPDDPFIASGQNGFQGGNLENNSYDIVLLQRLTFAAGFNF